MVSHYLGGVLGSVTINQMTVVRFNVTENYVDMNLTLSGNDHLTAEVRVVSRCGQVSAPRNTNDIYIISSESQSLKWGQA